MRSLVVVLCCATWAAPVSAQQHARASHTPSPSVRFVVPDWPFPRSASTTGPALPKDSITPRHVPHSLRSYTDAYLGDMYSVADWHPASHPAMPAIVSRGRKPAVYACAYCHLPDGQGRPENATLAGLPMAYVEEQLADLKSGARQTATARPYAPFEYMQKIASSLTPAEVRDVAEYFSKLGLHRRPRIVESTKVPAMVIGSGLYLHAPHTTATEPLGHRVIEMPVSTEQHERHDSDARYVAYVPPGSVARGRILATLGPGKGLKGCTGCHGPDLRGVGVIPPLAGRSPSYIVRQLLAFKTGKRATAASAPMNQIAGALSIDDMIAAAAYAGSRAP
ncbi:MAG TPA: c-type cytochrome [Gemmatimonadaceae bacterium]|nr:c-type cytochrome [Gemmatimonadaceae bacterium]